MEGLRSDRWNNRLYCSKLRLCVRPRHAHTCASVYHVIIEICRERQCICSPNRVRPRFADRFCSHLFFLDCQKELSLSFQLNLGRLSFQLILKLTFDWRIAPTEAHLYLSSTGYSNDSLIRSCQV